MIPSDSDARKRLWLGSAPITLVGVLLTAIIGSTIYDLMVRPGLSGIAKYAVLFTSWVSSSVSDGIYGTASGDPASLAVLLLMFFVYLILAVPSIAGGCYVLVDRLMDAAIRGVNPNDDEKAQYAAAARVLRRKFKTSFLIIFGFYMVLLIFSYFSVVLVAASLQIRTATDINIARISGYVDSNRERQLRSALASVEDKAGFERFRGELEEIAQKHGVSLVKTEF